MTDGTGSARGGTGSTRDGTGPARDGTGPLLSVQAVCHGYGRGARWIPVLHAVSLRVAAGELVALAGRSGSGKSTLCHLIAGVERPTEGAVLVAGRRAGEVRDWRLVSLLPQRLTLVPELTVRENALLPAWLRGTPAGGELLERLGLAALADRRITHTSLGEQQRTAIARTLVLAPRLAVLDEPTAHQDDEHAERVIAALVAAHREGSAVLVATHDERVLAAASRVVRLDGGRVVAPGRVDG